ILMPLSVALALTLPAASVQTPEADCPAPSVLSVTGDAQLAIPDKPSAPVNVTVTLVLFQPAAFGLGAAVALAVGGVLSIFTVTETEAKMPAIFAAEHVKVV